MQDSDENRMNAVWQEGLEHFHRSNYYAARDRWLVALGEAQTVPEQARIANSLGAAAFRLAGFEEARTYFERAIAFSQRTENPDPLRTRYVTNLAQVLLYSEHPDAAVKTAKEAAELASAELPDDAANALSVCVSVFIHNEMYRDVMYLHNRWQEISGVLPEASRALKTARFMHNLGYASSALNDTESAMRFYRMALATKLLPETMRELSRLYLLQGNVMKALTYADGLYPSAWRFTLLEQKSELAECLVLTGMFAYYAGRRGLFARCVEKAELYYGQLSRWDEWLRMRDLEHSLTANPAHVRDDAMDWEQWACFLDDLTLRDSLEALFPSVFRMAQVATTLAVQLVETYESQAGQRVNRLMSAGLLSYLGLTAMCTTDRDAKTVLLTGDRLEEMNLLSVRLLDVYPHSAAYRNLIRYSRGGDAGSPAENTDLLLAHCLGVAFDYVERMEILGFTHQQAVSDILESARNRYMPEVLERFARYMDVGSLSQ